MASLPLKTRFAPSPTGYLHLGHVAHLLYVFGLSDESQAPVALRIENHDQSRCRPEYQDAILEDIRWLGFDAFGTRFLIDRLSIQSSRFASYEQTARHLYDQGLVYGCSCSRKQIQDRAASQGAHGYDGYCRDKGLPFDGAHGLRFRITDEPITFSDTLKGTLTQHPAREGGDFLIRERSGLWTYQFAVVADDIAETITWIIRGEDILDSTGRQILLAEALGRKEQPLFSHHPLIVDDSGRKLAKRDRDAAILQRRLAGEAPETVMGEAAYAVGLLDRNEPLSLRDLPGLFRS